MKAAEKKAAFLVKSFSKKLVLLKSLIKIFTLKTFINPKDLIFLLEGT